MGFGALARPGDPRGGWRRISLLGGAALAGCMLSPWDGYEVSDPGESIYVFGFHLEPGVPLVVEAWNYDAGQFEPVAEAWTEGTPTPLEEPLFLWSVNEVSLDERFWGEVGCDGLEARVRTSEAHSGHSMLSVIADWAACWEANDYALGAFITRCTSPRAPEALVVTGGYSEFAPSIDGYIPDVLRAKPDYSWAVIDPELDRGVFSRLQMRVEHIGVSEIYECELRCGSWVCSITLRDSAFAELYEGAAAFFGGLSSHGAAISFRGYDTSACPNGPTWTDWTRPRTRWYHTYRAGEHCEPPEPEPEPEPEPGPETRLWDITCACETPYASGLIRLDACVTDDHPSALWQCQYFEEDFEFSYGTPMECSLVEYHDRGLSACVPGSRVLTDANIELYY